VAKYQVFYTLQNRVSSHFLDAESAAEAMGKLPQFYPQIKTAFQAQRVYVSKAVQEELTFTWTKEVSDFIYALLDGARFYIEGSSAVSGEIEDKYRELTGEILIPEKGVYNIAPDHKWGVEGTVRFNPALSFPEDFGIEPEKPGQVNSTKLFWVLVRAGFRLSGRHVINDIENFIPVEFRQVAGVA
jgi:hypothetical protein